MRPVKELADVANKLEVLEDLVEELQGFITDIKNVITTCSSWIDEKVDTTYQDIKQMLVSKTCDYVKQLFLMAHEKNGKLSEPVITEEMKIVSGIQAIETSGSDIKGSLDYKRLQENLKEITASIKSHSEMLEALQKRNRSLEKGKIKEIAANVKTHSNMIEILQEKNKVLEKVSEKLSKQNQNNEKICAEHYKEIMEELSVASSFMSNIKDENIKLSMKMTQHNKKVDDVSDRVYRGMEIVSEFAKDQHIIDELKQQNKKLNDELIELNQQLDNSKESIEKLTEENVELNQQLDNSKESIEKLTDENAKHQASLETTVSENQKLTEKLGFFPKDVLENVKRSLIDANKSNINFLLFGVCGSGKSALGNSILQKKCFQSCSSLFRKNNMEVQCEMGESNGRGIGVFECPDFNCLDEKQRNDLFKVTQEKVVAKCSQGYSVILFVLGFGSRITEEYIKCIEVIKALFSQNCLKKYGILVMTGGDNWEYYVEEAMSFQDWLQRQEGCLKNILTECNGRALLFDNKKKPNDIQLQSLMDMVDKLIYDNTFVFSTFNL